MNLEHWQAAFANAWGIEAAFTRLDGEYDLNFLATGADGAGYVVKAMRPGCEAWLVDMQIAALDHIRANAPDVPVPAVIRSASGAAIKPISDENGDIRLVWVLERLPGRCYAPANPKTPDLIHQVGMALGASAKALQDFTHDGLARDFK